MPDSYVFRTNHSLQAVGPNLVGGILMPFGVRNKRGRFCSRDTDFGLDVFPAKPLLLLHMLDGVLKRHGVFINESLELRDEGLFGVSSIDEKMVSFVNRFDSGFSLGSMMHLVEFGDDGHIDRFVFVEGSIGLVSDLANFPGTTEAVLQSGPELWPGVDLPDDVSLVRGVIVMSTDVELEGNSLPVVVGAPASVPVPGAVPEGVVEPVPVVDVLAAVHGSIVRIDERLQTLEDAPTRVLPVQSEPDPEPELQPLLNPLDYVASGFEHRSLIGLALEDNLRRSWASHDPVNNAYVTDNKLVRHMVDQMREEVKIDRELVAPPRSLFADKDQVIETIPDYMISLQCMEKWHGRVPYLMADEAMKTDFTNFGAELVTILLNSLMYHFIRAKSVVFGKLTVFEVPADSYPSFKWPKTTSGPVFRLVKEVEDDVQLSPANSPIPASKVGTSDITWTAGGIGARTIYSMQLLKSSTPGFLDAIAMEYALQAANDIDYVLVNGDETASVANISSLGTDPTGLATDKILAIDGLREIALTVANDAAAEATIAVTTPGVARAKMGTRGVIGEDPLAIKLFTNIESSMLKWNELSEFESAADAGIRSTLVTGKVGAVKGVEIFSTTVIEQMDANGKIDVVTPANNVKGASIVVHPAIVRVGMFQQLQTLTEVFPHARAWQISSTAEFDVQQMEDGGTIFLFNHTQ